MKNVLSYKAAAVEFRKLFPALMGNLPRVSDNPDVIRERKEFDRLEGIAKEVERLRRLDYQPFGESPTAGHLSAEELANKFLAGTPIEKMPNITTEGHQQVLYQIKKGIEQKISAQKEKLTQTENRVKREMRDNWKQWYIDEIVKPEISAMKQLNKILQKKVVADGEFNGAGLEESYRPGIVTIFERVLLMGGRPDSVSSLEYYIETFLCQVFGLDEKK